MDSCRARGGFTLIEIMVVVIIIAALAGMVIPHFIPATQDAKSKIAQADLAQLSITLKLFHLHNNRYPAQEEGLDILLRPSTSSTWKAPYLEKPPLDPWKNMYRYRYPPVQNSYGPDLWSMGPDGQDGGGDDVCNWDEKQ